MARPFELAVIGDSILWGQGLSPEFKISTLLKGRLERNVSRMVNVQLLAHSGAIIPAVPEDGGTPPGPEVPSFFPSVTAQAHKVAHPERIDLVLVNGGMNDFNPKNIFDPSITDLTWYARQAKHFCEDRLSVLLPDLLTLFPRAKIVVLGYYPLVSSHTSLTELPRLLGFFGLEIPVILIGWALREKLAPQSRAFRDAFDQSVRDVLALLNSQRLAFVSAPFGPQNCYAAEDTFLWKTLERDLVLDDRRGQCAAVSRSTDLGCIWANAVHPNQRGAQAYADAIFHAIVPWLDDWMPTPRISFEPAPDTIVAGRRITLRVTAQDRITHDAVPGMLTLDNDSAKFSANVPFDYTFHGSQHFLRLEALDYDPAGEAFSIRLLTLKVGVTPFPVPLGEPTQVIVTTSDAETGFPVAARVKITQPQRLPSDPPQPPDGYPTNVPFTHVFRARTVHLPNEDVSTLYPTAIASAPPDYGDAPVDLGFADIGP